jgi:hypothetical protein
MRWWEWPFSAAGFVVGFALAWLVLAFAVLVVAVHASSFAFCAVGLHAVGHWIRREMTLPVLTALRDYCAELRAAATRKL